MLLRWRLRPVLLMAGWLLFAVTGIAQNFTTLRQAADYAGIRTGTAADADLLTDSAYTQVLAREYNLLQPENDMKWAAIHPGQNTYDFSNGDALVAFAGQNNMLVRGHNLVWNVYNPSWLQDGNGATSFNASQLSSILQDHITTVVSHYAGQVYAWDVVNEAFDDTGDGRLKSSIWYDSPGIGASGTGYIEQAFRWARAADPNALLFYNEYSIEDAGPKVDAVYAMVAGFKNRGVPIDGVGFQMHIALGGYPTVAGFAANLRRFTALGVQVQITEMDVRLAVGSNGQASAADLQSQAAVYAGILNVCLANPLCTAFQTWGFTDAHSWIPSFFSGFGAALPFDQDYVAKPAYDSIFSTVASSAPRFSSLGVVNAANYSGGGIAPGELITVFGGAMGPMSLAGLQLDASGKVATQNSDVTVAFDGSPAPLVYVSATQLAAVVPYEVAGKATTHMVITYRDRSASADLNVQQFSPGLLTSDASGSGIVAAINLEDGTIQSLNNPASAGSYMELFGTGDGVESGGYSDGSLIDATNLPVPAQKVTATIGGESAPVLYAGGAPGLVAGVLQINLRIPADLAPGKAYPVVISIGGASSRQNAVIAVK